MPQHAMNMSPMNNDDQDPAHPGYPFHPSPASAAGAHNHHINHPYQQSHEAQSAPGHSLMAARLVVDFILFIYLNAK